MKKFCDALYVKRNAVPTDATKVYGEIGGILKLVNWITLSGKLHNTGKRQLGSPRADLTASEKKKIFCLCQESNENSSIVQPVIWYTKYNFE